LLIELIQRVIKEMIQTISDPEIPDERDEATGRVGEYLS
jgi:hypothetical protein